MHKKAFTLIELLVVIAIIGILLAVITPAMNKAREKTRAAHCANNLRQIGIAFYMYVDDNGRFPPYTSVALTQAQFLNTWYGRLNGRYVDDSTVFHCQSHPKWRSSQMSLSGYQFDYILRQQVLGQSDRRLPSGYAYVAGKKDYTNPEDVYYFLNWTSLSRYHTGGTNILYWDGHVEWHRPPPEPPTYTGYGYGVPD